MLQGVLLDISGVLYVDDQPVQGSIEALERLRSAGLKMRLVTNSSRAPGHAIVEKLRHMGFNVDAEHLLTAPQAIHAHLRAHALTPLLLVHPALRAEFADLEAPDPNAVVVCDAGAEFTYERLDAAFQLLSRGAPLLAVGDNRYFWSAGALHLDAGPFVRALAYAAEVEPVYLGKPAVGFFEQACAAMGTRPEHTWMVGDDWEADVVGALNAGLQASLVTTGKYRAGDETRAGRRKLHLGRDLISLVNQRLGE